VYFFYLNVENLKRWQWLVVHLRWLYLQQRHRIIMETRGFEDHTAHCAPDVIALSLDFSRRVNVLTVVYIALSLDFRTKVHVLVGV
jgi:hypothetical protein